MPSKAHYCTACPYTGLEGVLRRCVECVVGDFEERKGLRLILHVCQVHQRWQDIAMETSHKEWVAWAADGWSKAKVLKDIKKRLGYLSSLLDAIKVETVRISKEVNLGHDPSCSCQGH